jgi:hypothetical protein
MLKRKAKSWQHVPCLHSVLMALRLTPTDFSLFLHFMTCRCYFRHFIFRKCNVTALQTVNSATT